MAELAKQGSYGNSAWRGMLGALVGVGRRAPLAPAAVAEVLRQKTFTSGADAEVVVELYAKTARALLAQQHREALTEELREEVREMFYHGYESYLAARRGGGRTDRARSLSVFVVSVAEQNRIFAMVRAGMKRLPSCHKIPM